MGIDITERKRAREDREKLVKELEARNAELERFAYTVSHDLKSPLITINGFLHMLEQGVSEGDAGQMKDDISHITDATDRMRQLLDGLLELARTGRVVNEPEPIVLGELLRESVELVAGQIAARGVEVEIPPELPVVYGDRVRLREVFQNLIENAVKHMGDQPAPRIEIGVRAAGGETVCYVCDNGVGIDPRHQEKIFGLFEKLDPTSEGAGVGLALVKRIAEVHGGRIWVESEGIGKGSTFCCTIQSKT